MSRVLVTFPQRMQWYSRSINTGTRQESCNLWLCYTWIQYSLCIFHMRKCCLNLLTLMSLSLQVTESNSLKPRSSICTTLYILLDWRGIVTDLCRNTGSFLFNIWMKHLLNKSLDVFIAVSISPTMELDTGCLLASGMLNLHPELKGPFNILKYCQVVIPVFTSSKIMKTMTQFSSYISISQILEGSRPSMDAHGCMPRPSVWTLEGPGQD